MPHNDRQARALQCIRTCLTQKGRAPSVRELAECMGFSSPRSAAMLIEELVAAEYVAKGPTGRIQLRRDAGSGAKGVPTVSVPILGSAPCGSPFHAEENLEGHVRVDVRLARPPHSYFIVRAVGDSMDRAGIDDGDLVLVRSSSEANNGDHVVALVDGEVTIKTLKRGQSVVSLEPRSSNPNHKPIFASSDLAVQGVVVTSLS